MKKRKNNSYSPQENKLKPFFKTMERGSKIDFEDYVKRMDLVEYLENSSIHSLAVILINGFNPEELYLPPTIPKEDRIEIEKYFYKIIDNLEKSMLSDFNNVIEPLIEVVKQGKAKDFLANRDEMLGTIYSLLFDYFEDTEGRQSESTYSFYNVYLLEVFNTLRKHIQNIAYIMFPTNLSAECINTFLIHTSKNNERNPLYLFLMSIIYLRLLRNKTKLALPFISKENKVVDMYLDTQDFKDKLDKYIIHYLGESKKAVGFSFVNYMHASRTVVFASFETLNVFMEYIRDNITYRELKF